jgi:hypothetical protein
VVDSMEDDLTSCECCGDLFEPDELYSHEDGNLYCHDCNYATEQDRLDGEADRLLGEMEDR